MTELTFSAGERATLDLRDSQGDVRLQDADGTSIVVSTEDGQSPFVLRDGDTFRIRLLAGGKIGVPRELAVEVFVPSAVHLRLHRSAETVVTPREASTGAAGATPPSAADLSEFARQMSEQGRRIFSDMTDKVRQGGTEASDDVARRLDEAAGRIDVQVQRVAQRVEREVERAFGVVERATQRAAEHGHPGAAHTEHDHPRHEHSEHKHAEHTEHAAERARRAAERAARRTGRGRWWFTEKLDEMARGGPCWGDVRTAVEGGVRGGTWSGFNGGAGPSAPRPEASPEERRAILDMLAAGTITSEQAATLLDALGG
ncbi:MAG: hypothetical protein M3442_11805 [Chloroflexota bacterium]|nr:hypothetical protein [Chloroflexota bacterium]